MGYLSWVRCESYLECRTASLVRQRELGAKEFGII